LLVEMKEGNKDWRIDLENDYNELIALFNCIDSVDIHFLGQILNLDVQLFDRVCIP
jgi:hypothetical protein